MIPRNLIFLMRILIGFTVFQLATAEEISPLREILKEPTQLTSLTRHDIEDKITKDIVFNIIRLYFEKNINIIKNEINDNIRSRYHNIDLSLYSVMSKVGCIPFDLNGNIIMDNFELFECKKKK